MRGNRGQFKNERNRSSILEWKICLPPWKLVYSLLFMALLSLVRAVVYVEEIGPAIEEPMALLAAVFCADTYLMEVQSGRAEIFALYSRKKKTAVLFRRLAVQNLYLLALFLAGYWLFFWQRPFFLTRDCTAAQLYGMYASAAVITIPFWSILSVSVSILFWNMWAGIGAVFLLWLSLVSKGAEELLGEWGLFSYASRSLGRPSDLSWLWGKGLTLLLAFVAAALILWILKKTEGRK